MPNSSPIRWLSLGILVIGVAAGISEFFKVQTISCSLTTGNPCPEKLLALLSPLQKKPLFTTDFPAEISQHTLDSAFTLESHQKELPNQLTVVFYQEPPAYQLQLGEQLFSISQSGAVLPPELSPNVDATTTTQTNPTLVITYQAESPLIEEIIVPEQLHHKLTALTSRINLHKLQPSQITWISQDEIRLSFPDNLTVLLDHTAPADTIDTVATIVLSDDFATAIAAESGQVELDVRFKLPVLRTSQ